MNQAPCMPISHGRHWHRAALAPGGIGPAAEHRHSPSVGRRSLAAAWAVAPSTVVTALEVAVVEVPSVAEAVAAPATVAAAGGPVVGAVPCP
ncbi:hypothetical protein CYMTET_7503 [Cymbomonas tetramitiformis]|uniref:Uncharacterized protein n=1 Tax=Cymbomonas tetramitiformis TaxID=36881 RepID=A0AAE0GVC0_9CHLO|nr:hypothetical protein CYMTET_7503 [Cymbomonas tetramitiformis]